MRKIFRIIALVLLTVIVLTSCSGKFQSVMNRTEKTKYLYLVVGFDDAAENTDVMFTAAFDKDANTASFVQIPRDTYCNLGISQNKINQIYAAKRASGASPKVAMSYTASVLSDLLGVSFDGYVGITTTAFRDVVDALGGVEIEISSDMTLALDDGEELHLKRGKNLIRGKDAERFVRYRQGYAMGDLSRIDAQKLFLNAVFKKAATGMSLPALISIASSVNSGIITDINLRKILSLAISSLKSAGIPDTLFVTIPGEPTFASNNLSYYVLNRKNAAEVVEKYMFSSCEFDRERKFTNEKEIGFNNIYNDCNSHYKEYRNDDINKVIIK